MEAFPVQGVRLSIATICHIKFKIIKFKKKALVFLTKVKANFQII